VFDHYRTQRLSLDSVSAHHLDFVFELVNTPEWLKFIGNRNVTDKQEARYYIQKIIDNPHIFYWVVSLQHDKTPLGIVTFIKREYFEHFDLGFAFLKRFTGKGYAYESAKTVLDQALQDPKHSRILATTLEDNHHSIALLKKLNFSFEKKINEAEEELLLYAIDRPVE